MTMHLPLHIRLPHIHKPNLNLLPTPPQTPRHGPQRNGLQPIDQDGAPIQADHFQHFVARPCADGDVEEARRDVGEARFAHHVCQQQRGVEVDAEARERCDDVAPEFGDFPCGWHGAVVAVGVVVDFLELEPTSWFQMTMFHPSV